MTRAQRSARPWILRLALVALPSALLACSDTGSSSTCEEICEQEVHCAQLRDKKTDNRLEECVAGCVALDRDIAGRKLVENYVECVKRTGGSCEERMQCTLSRPR